MKLGQILKLLSNAEWIMIIHKESVSIDIPWIKTDVRDIFMDNAKETVLKKFDPDTLVDHFCIMGNNSINKANTVKIVLA